MKKLILLIFLLIPAIALSQGKPGMSADCIKYLSYYQQDYKAKKFDSALPYWRNALKHCPPNASQNMYVHGTTMMTKLYGKVTDPARREAIVDTILMLQDIRVRTFPQKKTEILNNKGLYMVKFRGKDARFLYDNLPPLIDELRGDAAPTLGVSLFRSAIELYHGGSVSGDGVLEAYDLVSDAMDAYQPENDEQKKDIADARTVVGTLFADSGVADCQSIVEVFTPRLDNDPDNASLAATIVRLLNTTEDCAGTELYFRAVTSLHRQAPSHRSAYALYRMNAARGNSEEACSYIEQAIADDGADTAAKARYWYEYGLYAYKNKMRPKALEAARKAVELDCGYAGRGYLLIGNLWSSAPSDDELTQYARYWAAADNYLKAKELDPEVEKDANAGLATAAKHYPEPSEIFMFDLEAGQGYTVNCAGMSARTTVRVKKR